MEMMQHVRTRFLGLDVHRDTIAVALAEETGQPTSHSTIANDPGAVRKLVQRLTGPEVRLIAAYEAGPTGYTLHRQLVKLGVECMVVAPSLIPKRAGDRVKTDRRDALKLTRLLRSGDLTPIWVPDEAHEALRSLVRARADAKADELRAKHRLSKFLLRQGIQPPPGVRNWSARHHQWLNRIQFDQLADRVVFGDYLAEVRAAGDRVKRLEAALRECAQTASQQQVIVALQAIRGIGFLTAVTIVAEAGDLRRFASAPQFMAYVGLVPTEHSSGSSQHRGAITKTGNSLLRHVLGEAAHHARHVPRVQGELKQRQANLPEPVIALAWQAQLRLHARYRHLAGRLGPRKALTAVARELAGFVWALGQQFAELEVAAAA